MGQPYLSSLVATGGVPPYTYSISAGSLPSGLALNPSSGAIAGTPTAAGAFSDTSRVVDSAGGSATSSCGITIAPAAADILSVTCSFPSGTVGQPYLSSLVAHGGVPPYIFFISAGSLPTGLALTPSSGAIAGTPATAGAFGDTSTVLDSAGASAASDCGITIAPAGVALSLTCASNSGQVGRPYVSSLVAAGGTPPYTYSISAGSLPPGLTLDSSTGAISGTPVFAGTFDYTARVVDSAGASATASCGPLVVAPAPAPPPPAVPAPPSLILAGIGMAYAAMYQARERLLRRLRKG